MKKLILALAGASLVAAPVVAQVERAVEPVEDGSDIAGAQGITVLVGALAVALGVILLVDDDDDPASP